MAIDGDAHSGPSAGVLGVGGTIHSTFLPAFDLPKATYVFTSGAIAFVIGIARIATLRMGKDAP